MSDKLPTQEELLSRLKEVESILMHVQHEVEQLNDAILKRNSEVDRLNKTLKLLDSRLGVLEEEDEGHGPEFEKPPHY
ncbi:MAG: SlyX family protein [Planctomycetes bacterium]|nr:SlyX family protein [Planctomycetota bacterium]MCH9725742.1 SlyX family protein [Planctomycetota bacterium]MCH9777797.1 SlyX family protein [Planctomycetota bacterium]MCH9789837.1 SlyX family protein [Planctomycetota bacterium]MDF1744603.1 SlyX family protein [Gimesia sp.]